LIANASNNTNSTDSKVEQLSHYAILQTLNTTLLASKSATQTLQKWCDDHHIASPAKIRAVRDEQILKKASNEIRHILKVSNDEKIGYRSVQLFCGEYVLSEADNWYVPCRLTDEMNNLLNNSDMPFGLAVQSLNFHRRTDEVLLLWQPVNTNWDQTTTSLDTHIKPAVIPDQVLQHRAVLMTDQNVPFSIVIETYTKNIFLFK
jgi:acid phosphatase class B